MMLAIVQLENLVLECRYAINVRSWDAVLDMHRIDVLVAPLVPLEHGWAASNIVGVGYAPRICKSLFLHHAYSIAQNPIVCQWGLMKLQKIIIEEKSTEIDFFNSYAKVL